MFRVAAGPRVGYGHLMRARALAGCLGMHVAVSLRGGRAARLAADVIGPLVDDPGALAHADLLIVDDPSRTHGEAWIARARRAGIRSVSVHDDAWAHDADLVVCGALGAERPRTSATALHGVRFYLLDSRIAGARHLRTSTRAMNPPHVLVALGGGQHVLGLAQRLVDAMVACCPGANIAVAAGFSSRRRPALRGATWLSARTGLTRALLDADVAVVAGGVTLYEACALGVPAVGLAVVPEQRRTIRAFASHAAIIDAGSGRGHRAPVAAAAAGVSRLLTDGRLRRKTAARARALVDGRGAERVARRIRALLETEGRLHA